MQLVTADDNPNLSIMLTPLQPITVPMYVYFESSMRARVIFRNAPLFHVSASQIIRSSSDVCCSG
jgi:hypothetical protein